MSVQYQTKVPWDTTLIDVEYTDADTAPVALQGLVKYAVKVTAGSPTATPKYFLPGAIVSNAITGVNYQNIGTISVPSWAIIDVSSGGLPALPSAQIWVGNGSNIATAVTLSGDLSVANTGTVTVTGASGTFAALGNIEVTGGVVAPGGVRATAFYPVGSNPQALSGPGAANVTTYQTQFTSTGVGDAITLATGSQIGHVKKITYVAEAGGADTGIITPVASIGFATVTLNAIGDYVVFVWTGAAWAILEYFGATVA